MNDFRHQTGYLIKIKAACEAHLSIGKIFFLDTFLPVESITVETEMPGIITTLTVGNKEMLAVPLIVRTGGRSSSAANNPAEFSPPCAEIALTKQTSDILTALVAGNTL